MEVDAEPEREPEVVEATAAEEVVPTKVLKHQYYNNSQLNPAGGLACVWVQLLFSDGSKTNGVVAWAPLAGCEAGRAMLRAYMYVLTKRGQKKKWPSTSPFEALCVHGRCIICCT